MLYTYINRHAGTPDKNTTKHVLGTSTFIQDLIKAFSLEHRKCYNIVTGKEK